MWGYRVGRWALAGVLALALAGCSGNDTGGLFAEGTSEPPPAPTSRMRPRRWSISCPG